MLKLFLCIFCGCVVPKDYLQSMDNLELSCRICSICLYHGILHPPFYYLHPSHMDVSKNSGTPKSSILIGFSIINHPFWGYPYFWKHPYNEPLITASYSFSNNFGKWKKWPKLGDETNSSSWDTHFFTGPWFLMGGTSTPPKTNMDTQKLPMFLKGVILFHPAHRLLCIHLSFLGV